MRVLDKLGTGESMLLSSDSFENKKDIVEVEPHGFSLLRRSSFGCEGWTAVVPLVSSAEPAEPTPPK